MSDFSLHNLTITEKGSLLAGTTKIGQVSRHRARIIVSIPDWDVQIEVPDALRKAHCRVVRSNGQVLSAFGLKVEPIRGNIKATDKFYRHMESRGLNVLYLNRMGVVVVGIATIYGGFELYRYLKRRGARPAGKTSKFDISKEEYNPATFETQAAGKKILEQKKTFLFWDYTSKNIRDVQLGEVQYSYTYPDQYVQGAVNATIDMGPSLDPNDFYFLLGTTIATMIRIQQRVMEYQPSKKMYLLPAFARELDQHIPAPIHYLLPYKPSENL